MNAHVVELPGVEYAIGPPEPKPPTLAFDLLDIGITHAVNLVIIDRMVSQIDRAAALYAGRASGR